MTDGCVKFNKSSWHYRITNYVFWIGSYKTNLCPYMRMVIASIFLIPFIYGWRKLPDKIQDNAWIVQGELIFLSLIIIVAFIIDWNDNIQEDIFPPLAELIGYGFFGGNALGLIGLGMLISITTLQDYIHERPKKEHRTRGLIKTYMEAKHNKICPCVEFE